MLHPCKSVEPISCGISAPSVSGSVDWWKFIHSTKTPAWSFPSDDNPSASMRPPSHPSPRWQGLLCISRRRSPSLWCFYLSVRAPAVHASVWKEARCIKRPRRLSTSHGTLAPALLSGLLFSRCFVAGGVFMKQTWHCKHDTVKQRVARFSPKGYFGSAP